MDKKSYMDMLKNTDVYVSLHRSEGLGKTILEAMAYGIPVVTTAYGGHMDITDKRNSVLVPFDMVKIEDDVKILGHPVYRAGNQWANPNINDAAMAMRRLHIDTEFRTMMGETARQDIWRLLNPIDWANFLIQRLRKVQKLAQK
jgi:glycosyltransferase involved in cell wall biosynthesis